MARGRILRRVLLPGFLAVLLVQVAGCGESSDSGRGVDVGAPPSTASGGAASGSGGSSSASGGALGDDDLEELPDEEKDLSAFRAPVVTGDYLWFANPDSNRVALIDAVSLEVLVLEGGFRPTHVAAVSAAQGSSALVLNTGSQDATWFHVRSDSIGTKSFDVHPRANRWAVAPSGRWAVAFSTAELGEELDPVDGLQDITLAHLAVDPPEVHRLTVGYRPLELTFTADETRLLVVADAGLSVIDLEADVPVTQSWLPLGAAVGRSVAVTPDGAYALVSHSNRSVLQIVPLDGGAAASVTLGGPIHDLTLSADGQLALLVLRGQRQVAVLELPDIVADPDVFDSKTFPGEVFGSAALSPDGQSAVLYTTAVAHPRVVVVDLRPGATYLDHRAIDVGAPVQSVQTTPDGEHAIVLMGQAQGSARPGSFAQVSLRAARFPRIQPTLSPVHRAAVDSTHALLTTRDDRTGIFESYLLEVSSGRLDQFRLASPPTAVGILTAQGLGYVAQSHPEGRVTLLNFSNAKARTLTGFELSSKVVE